MIQYMNIDRIKLREQRRNVRPRMTGEALAKAVGISRTYYSKIENGAYPSPSRKLVRRLAEVLGCTVGELLMPEELADGLSDEKLILDLWRQLDSQGKTAVIAAGHWELKRVLASKGTAPSPAEAGQLIAGAGAVGIEADQEKRRSREDKKRGGGRSSG